MSIYALGDDEPEIDELAYVAPEAVVIGRVKIGPEASVWPGAVLRGDHGFITVGARTSVQDGTVVHDSIWWMHEGNRALRVGDWKIVAAGKASPWELYDMTSDRSETRDMAKDRPDKVRELAAMWTKQLADYCALAAKDLPPSSR